MSDAAPSTPREPAQALVARIRALRAAHRGALVLASDIDGALAPIVPAREHALVAPGALAALGVLRAGGAVTCVVTGRALDDARAMLGEAGARAVSALIAEHGAAWLGPDGARHAEAVTPAQRAALEAFAPHAAAFTAAFSGAALERKPTAVAVHVRGVPAVEGERARADAGLVALADVAHRLGLASIAGRAVLEVRPHLSDKGTALARVREHLAPGAPLVYAGDDTTDEPAIVLAAQHGLGVYVASGERPDAPSIPSGSLAVTDQATWVAALELLAREG